jgi:hypothetical protein
MGKGSNVQKAQAARERNAKKEGKSPEERAASAKKAAADNAAFICNTCKMSFMVNVQKKVSFNARVSTYLGRETRTCERAQSNANNPLSLSFPISPFSPTAPPQSLRL